MRQAEVKPSNAVVVGQSAGGWGTIAYAGAQHPNVAAFVVMADGRGGHRDFRANNNCRPDLLANAAGRFGNEECGAFLSDGGARRQSL